MVYISIKEILKNIFGDEYGDVGNGYIRPKGLFLNILFQPDINEYMGRRSVQLKLKDIKLGI